MGFHASKVMKRGVLRSCPWLLAIFVIGCQSQDTVAKRLEVVAKLDPSSIWFDLSGDSKLTAGISILSSPSSRGVKLLRLPFKADNITATPGILTMTGSLEDTTVLSFLPTNSRPCDFTFVPTYESDTTPTGIESRSALSYVKDGLVRIFKFHPIDESLSIVGAPSGSVEIPRTVAVILPAKAEVTEQDATSLPILKRMEGARIYPYVGNNKSIVIRYRVPATPLQVTVSKIVAKTVGAVTPALVSLALPQSESAKKIRRQLLWATFILEVVLLIFLIWQCYSSAQDLANSFEEIIPVLIGSVLTAVVERTSLQKDATTGTPENGGISPVP